MDPSQPMAPQVVRSKQNNSLVANMVDFTAKRVYMAAGLPPGSQDSGNHETSRYVVQLGQIS